MFGSDYLRFYYLMHTYSKILFLLGILLPLTLFAQEPNPTQTIFYEKVYLHTDRNLYTAGEDIWYKAYLLNAREDQLLNTSHNLYVELISADAKILERKVTRLEGGFGAGDFKLGDSIPQGSYRIRAYTNWMKNFGDNFVFEKDIRVLNTIIPTQTNAAVSSSKSIKPLKTALPDWVIHFYPEGGSMIENVNGVVAFKAERRNGTIERIKGVIIASDGDTVANFNSEKFSMGSFMLLPLAGRTYLAKGVYNDSEGFSVPLPDALKQGFGMKLINSDTANFKAIISTNEPTSESLKNRQFELRVRHSGASYAAVKFQMDGLQKMIEFPKKDFPEGILSITLSDDMQRAHCERLLYLESKKPINLVVLTDKPVYPAKGQVNVNLKITDERGVPMSSEVSMAAVDAAFVPEQVSNIFTYLRLESELRMKIKSPSQYFDPNNPNRQLQMDLLLLTVGWRDFIWKRLRDTTISISHLNENGFTVSGKVASRTSGKPLSDVNVSLFATGAEGRKLHGQKTNANGMYFFDNIYLKGDQFVRIVSANDKGNKVGELSMDSLFTRPLPIDPIEKPDTILSEMAKNVLQRKSELLKVSNSKSIEIKEVSIKSRRKEDKLRTGELLVNFGYKDQSFTITPDDYSYQSLSHYLLTNVDGAMLSDDPEYDGITFMNDGVKILPMVIANGSEYTLPDFVYPHIRMKFVEKIVVKHRLGGVSESGKSSHKYIIELTVKPAALEPQELSVQNVHVKGYYQERTFYSPAYPNNTETTKPDLRTTIYWNPKIRTNGKGEATVQFYNGDAKGKIRIAVEGVSLNGQPIVGSGWYEAK